MKAIEVTKLSKSYRSDFLRKKIPAVEGLSFSIESGRVTGFLGANGAGKSTSIKCILGLLIADEGEIRFFEKEHLSMDVKKRIGFLPERPFFYEYLAGEEFLRFYARLSGIAEGLSLTKKIDELLELVGLAHAKDKKLREYSKGMLQRIGIAQAIIHDPDLIIFDEPMSGLDPDGRFEVGRILREIASRGKTVFFSSHLLHDVQKLSEDLVILKKGNLMYQGELAPLIQDASTTYQVTSARDGKKISELVEGQQELQKRVDSLRLEKSDLIEVVLREASLEDAYVRLNK